MTDGICAKENMDRIIKKLEDGIDLAIITHTLLVHITAKEAAEIIAALKNYDELRERHKVLVDQCDDMYAMLKEHKAVKPKSKVRHGPFGQVQHFCGNCTAMLHGKQKFCSSCGKEVKWE